MILEYFMVLFIVVPIVQLIHELGHAFFAKLFGGELIKITIGAGKNLIRIGKIEIKRLFFYPGRFYAQNIKNKQKYTRLLIAAGGIIFNVLTAAPLWILLSLEIIPYHPLIRGFIFISFFTVLAVLVPMTYRDGIPSDGKVMYQLIKGDD